MPLTSRLLRIWARVAVLPLLWGIDSVDGGTAPGGPLTVKVDAGRFARRDCPVSIDLPAGEWPAILRGAPADGPKGLIFHEVLDGGRDGKPIGVQAERSDSAGESTVRLTWILAGETPAGASRTFRLSEGQVARVPAPWSLAERAEGHLELKNGERTVFRYNTSPSPHPNFGASLIRDAYIHPAFTPGGALITGDFSNFHPHHRGFFLAYTKTQVGDLHPDFWNIQGGSGKIHFDRLEGMATGPVTARFTAHHRWEAGAGKVVMRERWDVQAYDIPGGPYWLFDLTSTQQATETPIELPPYRYGGMAYRGPEPFVKGTLDVLTSEGRGRRERDQKPARWVDLTGPIEDGSDRYAGAMIADHPANVNHPTVARIHPTTLPFFCYVPSHDEEVTIGTRAPAVFRYRILIHDGHPDGDRDERIWRDFAEPPRVSVARTPD